MVYIEMVMTAEKATKLGHDQLSHVLSYAITVGTSFADIQLSFL